MIYRYKVQIQAAPVVLDLGRTDAYRHQVDIDGPAGGTVSIEYEPFDLPGAWRIVGGGVLTLGARQGLRFESDAARLRFVPDGLAGVCDIVVCGR